MGMVEPKEWIITPWQMNGHGGWKVQPVILVEGREPFFANHPDDYIRKIEALHDDPEVYRGEFNTMIGQLKDALEVRLEVDHGTNGVN